MFLINESRFHKLVNSNFYYYFFFNVVSKILKKNPECVAELVTFLQKKYFKDHIMLKYTSNLYQNRLRKVVRFYVNFFLRFQT